MVPKVLAIVMGIPGCGKTTLCSKLSNMLSSKYQCFHLNFDSVIPPDLQFSNNSEDKEWKHWRSAIHTLLFDWLIDDGLTEKRDMSQEQPDPSLIALKDRLTTELSNSCDLPQVILLDDNFYYRSMRHVYYTLAKSQCQSFCTIYCSCPIEVAIQRDRTRMVPVGERVIEGIAGRLEPPDPAAQNWEKFSISIDCGGDASEDSLISVGAIIDESLHSPFQPLDTSERDESRAICAASVVHQFDSLLRLVVSKIMHTRGAPWCKIHGRDVSRVKQEMLDDFRSGKLCLSSDVQLRTTQSCDHSDSDFCELKRIFETRIETNVNSIENQV